MVARIKKEFINYINWVKEEKSFWLMLMIMLAFEIIVLIWR